jgi:hypothetical protein
LLWLYSSDNLNFHSLKERNIKTTTETNISTKKKTAEANFTSII